MTPHARILATLALGALLAWRLGCLLMRTSGVLFIVAGLGELATGAYLLRSVVTLALGAAVWLAGRRLDALRHRAYRGPLAERLLSKRSRLW
jgi:hypothetical protein